MSTSPAAFHFSLVPRQAQILHGGDAELPHRHPTEPALFHYIGDGFCVVPQLQRRDMRCVHAVLLRRLMNHNLQHDTVPPWQHTDVPSRVPRLRAVRPCGHSIPESCQETGTRRIRVIVPKMCERCVSRLLVRRMTLRGYWMVLRCMKSRVFRGEETHLSGLQVERHTIPIRQVNSECTVESCRRSEDQSVISWRQSYVVTVIYQTVCKGKDGVSMETEGRCYRRRGGWW